MLRKLTIFGALGALIYLIHVVLGGILWEGYSHLMQPISDLTATGAPDRGLLNVITFIYGVFSIIFSISAYLYIRNFAPKIAVIGMFLFLAMHVVSITYGLFPQDLPGSPVTFTGVMHLIITGIIIPLTIASPILVGLGTIKIKGFKRYGIYSIITGVLILIAGGTTAFFFINKLPYFGLIERINIGFLQLWMVITSIKLFTTPEQDHFSERVT